MTQADGNSIDVDNESAKLAANALEQQAAVAVAKTAQRDPALGHGCRLMSMFGGMEISASALTAQRLRMNVTAENLANAETTKGADGNPYRRKEVVAAVGRARAASARS